MIVLLGFIALQSPERHTLLMLLRFEMPSWKTLAGSEPRATWDCLCGLPLFARQTDLSSVLNEFDLEAALGSCADSRRGRTQGLAWFLAGIAHARQANAERTRI